jgi:hypothetical protein
MEILKDFEKYKDVYGFNNTNLGPNPSQNGQLFTMEYLMCLMTSDQKPDHDTITSEILRLKSVYAYLERVKGTALRHPGSDEGNSMDNMVAHLVFDKMFSDGEFCKRFREHGKNTPFYGIDWEQGAYRNAMLFPLAWALNGFKPPKNFWHNTKEGWFCVWGWYGRSPGFIALTKWMAGEKVGFFGKLSILVGQFIGVFSKKTNSDARKLPYVLWYWLKDQGKLWKLSYRLWCWILLKQYGKEGIKKVYAGYYSPDHPIVKYSKPVID